MIFPGHVAASYLCHRYLKVDLRVALLAGVVPDVVDKLLYYGLHCVPSSRVPMHTLWAWLGTTLLLAAIALVVRRPSAKAWAWAWFAGYGAHLLCDSPLVGGKLPFLWPLLYYDFSSPIVPLSFLFGLDHVPVLMLSMESLLVAVATYLIWRDRRIARTEKDSGKAIVTPWSSRNL